MNQHDGRSIASTDRSRPSARYKWYVVGMLWFICFFNYADRQAIFSVFPLLESEFNFSKSELGMIGAAFTWTYALFAPIAGATGDRMPRKTVILAGLYVWSIITGFTAACSKLWHFVVVRATEGLGETFYFPASMSLISDYHDKRTRSRAMSLHQTSVYAGTIGGGALAGWLGEVLGWRSPFVLLAGVGVILGLVLAIFIREPRRGEAEEQPDAPPPEHSAAPIAWGEFFAECARRPTILALVVSFFGTTLVGVIFLVWMPTFLKEKFALSLGWAGLTGTFFIQMASMVGAIVGGMLADRWRMSLPGGRILVQSVGTLVGAPFIFLCGMTQEIPALIASMTAFGFFKGLYDANIWASLYDVVPVARRATAVGVMNMIGWLGGGLGAWAIGVAVDSGVTMGAAIGSTAVIYLVISVVLATAAFVLAPRDVARTDSDNARAV